MGTEKQNFGKIYAARAMDPLASPISIPTIREARDRVYSGTTNVPTPQGTNNDVERPHRSKNSGKRKISPFTVILILLATALVSVLYIGNILAVGRLLAQINQLQSTHQRIVNEHELLKAQMHKLAGMERIQQLAHDQLGLQQPKQLPLWVEIDPARVQQVEETIQQHAEQHR